MTSKKIKILLILVFIFFPIFISVREDYTLSVDRIPWHDGYLLSLPISFLFVIITFLSIYRLRFNLIHLSIILYSSYIFFIGYIYKSTINIKTGFAVLIFILTDLLFKSYFNGSKSKYNYKLVDKKILQVFVLLSILIIYSIIVYYVDPRLIENIILTYDDGRADHVVSYDQRMRFVIPSIVFYNWDNYFTLAFALIFAYLISNQLNSVFFILLLLSCVIIFGYLATSDIAYMLIFIWLISLVYFRNRNRIYIFKNFPYFVIILTLLYFGFALLSKFNLSYDAYTGFFQGSIRFRIIIIKEYFAHAELKNLFFALTPHKALLNTSPHSEFVSLLSSGGILYVSLFYYYLSRLIGDIPKQLWQFKLLLVLMIIFGIHVQNVFLSPYMAVIITFLINASYLNPKSKFNL